jgi:hypothetical protein
MPTSVTIGQKWSAWVPSRRQWLLATVIRREDGQATLKYDTRYEIVAGSDEQKADEAAMSTSPSLFRLIAP